MASDFSGGWRISLGLMGLMSVRSDSLPKAGGVPLGAVAGAAAVAAAPSASGGASASGRRSSGNMLQAASKESAAVLAWPGDAVQGLPRGVATASFQVRPSVLAERSSGARPQAFSAQGGVAGEPGECNDRGGDGARGFFLDSDAGGDLQRYTAEERGFARGKMRPDGLRGVW